MKYFFTPFDQRKTKKWLGITLISPFLLTGCHTIEGAGTDIKRAGQSIEQTAECSKNPCPPPPWRVFN